MQILNGQGFETFPVTFNLKVIMRKVEDPVDERTVLKNILLRLNIRHEAPQVGITKPDSRYLRFSVTVTLETREELESLYRELDREELVKAAI